METERPARPLLKIQKSWFYSAGDKYGWVKDGMDIRGVGIRADFLRKAPEIIVEVDRVKYLCRTAEALAFIDKYESFYRMPMGVGVGVISKDILEEISLL